MVRCHLFTTLFRLEELNENQKEETAHAPCDLVHVGDEWYPDFVFPRSIGIKGIYLDRTGEQTGRLIIKDLKKLGDLLQFL